MSITDASGNDVSSNSAHIANINPFRYRGYYYDTETGFYYLQSRYYDPVVGRFLNADAILGANGGIIGYNLFAYCGNNPVIYVDYFGNAYLPFPQLTYWGEIHVAVQLHIVMTYGAEMEVIKDNRIRADIVIGGKEVYEIKPVTWKYGFKRIMALAQLYKYVESDPNYIAGKTDISGEFIHRKFIVNYWSESDGLIFYSFKEIKLDKTEKQTKKNTVTVPIPEPAIAFNLNPCYIRIYPYIENVGNALSFGSPNASAIYVAFAVGMAMFAGGNQHWIRQQY